MDVHIVLTQDDWTCLSTAVKANSPLRPLFERPLSTDLGSGLVSIDCSMEEAERLLEIARQACRPAIIEIQKAITHAGQPH